MSGHPLSHEHHECGECSDCIADRVEIREKVIARVKIREQKIAAPLELAARHIQKGASCPKN